MTTLDLTEPEVAALLLLVKLGMDTYTLSGTPEDVIEALARVPNPTIDSVIAKLSRAGSEALKGGKNGCTACA